MNNNNTDTPSRNDLITAYAADCPQVQRIWDVCEISGDQVDLGELLDPVPNCLNVNLRRLQRPAMLWHRTGDLKFITCIAYVKDHCFITQAIQDDEGAMVTYPYLFMIMPDGAMGFTPDTDVPQDACPQTDDDQEHAAMLMLAPVAAYLDHAHPMMN
jgi:hypothetical protein